MRSSVLANLEDFYIKFGHKPLIEPFNLTIHERAKYCLVGRNGSGKSSFMKVFTGQLDYAHGKIWTLPGAKIVYLEQSERYLNNIKVIDFVRQGLKEDFEDNLAYKANILLDALKLNANDYVSELSGGNQRRASLAKALCQDADLLLLDEPTNHLDISSIEWLEKYLASSKCASIIISHDREFLRRVTDHTIWIDRGDVYVNNKGYIAYDEWSSVVIEEEINKLRKMEKELEKENLWLAQGVTARRKRNQQRLANLYDFRESLKEEKQKFATQQNRINFNNGDEQKSSKIVIELKNISKSFGEKKIINDFNLRIVKGDKVAIVGSNGSGKSTLVKIITGELAPDNGSVYKSPVLNLSYFEQDKTSLDQNKNPRQILCPSGGDQVMVNGKFKHVMAYLKDFMFTSEKANTICSSLSGGEQNRLLLARALADMGNLVILDEPTNDLDADTLDMLLEILSDFDGTVIIVSHDRDFLENFVTRTVIFNEDGIDDVIGGYLDYQREKIAQRDIQKAKSITNKSSIKNISNNDKKEIETKNKLSYKERFDLEAIDKKMPEIVEKIKTIEDFLLEEPDLYSKNQQKFEKSINQLSLLKKELEEMEAKWLDLEMKK
jgi:ATP-binding cassette subfamily F protein uup